MGSPVSREQKDTIKQTLAATQAAKEKAANTINAYTEQLKTVNSMLAELNGSQEKRNKNQDNIKKLEKLKMDLTQLINAMKQQHEQAAAVHVRLNALSK